MRGNYKWDPKLNLIREEFNIPDDVTLRAWSDDHDFKTGEGLEEGEIIFPCKHFAAIRFPLHPLVHNFFYRLNVTPVQVNPNSLRILSSALVLNIIKGWDLNLSDIFYCYKVSPIKDEHGFYYLTPFHKRAIVCGNPSSEKRWKEQLLIVGGNWSAPELHFQPIRTTFGRPAHPAPIKLDKKRIEFLQQTVLSSTYNSSTLLKDHYLLEVSRRRIGWEGLNLDSAIQAATAAAVVTSSEFRGSSKTIRSSEAAEEAEINSSMMRNLPTAPLPSMKKSHIKRTLTAEEILQRIERRESDQYDPKKQRLSTISIFPGNKYGDDFGLNQSHKRKGIYKEPSDVELMNVELPSEHNTMMNQDWKPNLIKADGKSVLKGESIEDDPEVCLALARGIWPPRDDLKLANAPASEFSSNAPLKLMQGLYCTVGLCKKVEAYEMKITKLETDLAKVAAKAEEADIKRLEAKRSLAKFVDAMQGKGRADKNSAQLSNEIEQMKKKVSETEALKKRINQLLKDNDETYKKFCKHVLEESAKSFRAGWSEALKNASKKTYPNPDAYDIACGLTPGQYLEDEDESSSSF